jgi:hypothetical protein
MRDSDFGVEGQERTEDAAVFEVLDEFYPALVSTAEVMLALGDRVGVRDALGRLHRAGLVHRIGDFVWLTRAAVRARELLV